MKVFQVIDGMFLRSAPGVLASAADAANKFPAYDVFVDAPDYVFESWGFDGNQEGDARFIKPTPPEGWAYDEDTGTFYEPPTPEQERENAYNTEPLIEWSGDKITVTHAATLFNYYLAEGKSDVCSELTELIAEAKVKIREKYPDEATV